MIKIEFPANNKMAALHLGRALVAIGGLTVIEVETTEALDGDEYPEGGPSEAEKAFNDGSGLTDGDFTEKELTDQDALAVDEHNVPFDVKYCGKAAVPYYTSGKKSGQWKRRQGVAEDTYDKWYAEQLEALKADTPAGQKQVDTSSAFTETATEPDANPVPKDGGDLMVWVSERQEAGLLTQPQVDATYVKLGFNYTDTFDNPSNPQPARIAANIKLVHAELLLLVGA
jgi:hypothetical protein